MPELLLELTRHQRRFEWELARDEHTRAAAQLVAGRTHDLLNLLQIIDLAVFQLSSTDCGAQAHDMLDELSRTSKAARDSLLDMMSVARPGVEIRAGAPVGPVVMSLLGTLHAVAPVDVHVAIPSDLATRCTAEEIEHVLIGMVLDAVDEPGPIELFVRERTINGQPWIEILRTTPREVESDGFELRVVNAVVTRAGGELATSERRDGGSELVVSLPVVRV